MSMLLNWVQTGEGGGGEAGGVREGVGTGTRRKGQLMNVNALRHISFFADDEE